MFIACFVSSCKYVEDHFIDKLFAIFFHFQVCKKKFISKEQLKRHTAIHTGIKPFKCQECNKCFNRRSTLMVISHQIYYFDKIGIMKCIPLFRSIKRFIRRSKANPIQTTSNQKLPRHDIKERFLTHQEEQDAQETNK